MAADVLHVGHQGGPELPALVGGERCLISEGPPRRRGLAQLRCPVPVLPALSSPWYKPAQLTEQARVCT